jgi:hypothetical protein
MKYSICLVLFLGMISATWAAKIVDREIQFDGRVDDSEWAESVRFDINYEIDPGNNVPGPFATQVFVNYSAEYLYVGFIATADMKDLRTSIRNRDEAWQDDFVMIGIDTYGDGRYMVNFGSNADGSPLDMKFTAEGNDDISYNVNFEAKATKHQDAYHVELKIPFNVLQYNKKEEHTWNVLLYRSTYSGDNRSQIINFPVDRANDCLPCQATSNIQLEGISSKKRVILIPSLVGSLNGEQVGGKLDYDKAQGAIGLSGLFDLSKTTTLEYAINPDFSQVEADVSQVTVNAPFAIEFPERRPFFNEGNDIIDTDLDLVYTRAINRPLLSTKLIDQGATSRTYWLTAYDEAAPYLIAGENESAFGTGSAAYSNVFRHQRNFKRGTNVGLISANRIFKNGGSGHNLGVDGFYRFEKKYAIGFDYAKSIIQEPVADWIASDQKVNGKTLSLDGDRLYGDAITLDISRSTTNWNSGLRYEQYSPHFQSPLGFITQNNIRRLVGRHSYQYFFKEKDFVKRLNAMVASELIFNYGGLRKLFITGGEIFAQMAHNIAVEFSAWKFFNQEFYGYNFEDLDEYNLFLRYNPNEKLDLRIFTSWGQSLFYDTENPEVGRNWFVGSFNDFQISPKLRFSPSIRYTQLAKLEGEELYYSGLIFRSNINYQFNRNLSLRLVGEVNTFNQGAFVQTLLRWNPTAFTIFYIGGTNGYAYSEGLRTTQLTGLNLYCKFQYQFGG